MILNKMCAKDKNIQEASKKCFELHRLKRLVHEHFDDWTL